MALNYGLDADLKRKQDAKYDVGLEKEVTEWIETVTGEEKGTQDVGDWLKDGKVLCKLANSIKPGSVKKINESTMPFKQMENITYFMDAARKLGVPETSLFGTPDLYEAKNLGSVVNCINTYGGVVQVAVPDFQGPKLGKAVLTESKDKARNDRKTADQSKGFAQALQVEKPTGHGIIRGQAATTSPTKSAGYSPGSSEQALAVATTPDSDAHTCGLDADLKKKQEAKYDVDLEQEVVNWIEAVGGEKKGDQSVQEWLKDGRILCQLANTVKPGSIAKVNTSTLAFKQMENITYFMNAARALGVSESGMFGTPDLYEEKNMGSVIKCIYMYGGAVQAAMPSFAGPKLGVAAVESKDTKREGNKCFDASGGFAKTMEVERPHDNRAAYKN